MSVSSDRSHETRPHDDHSPRWSHTEAERAIGLTLLVLRSGAKDSLGWWDDEALTEAGGFALARIFPRSPERVALRLAFRAAWERHAGALDVAGLGRALTLFDFTEALIEGIAAPPFPLNRPITSSDEFLRQLILLAPEIEAFTLPQPDPSGLLDLTPLAGCPDQTPAERVTRLAAGYLRANPRQPVFPFVHLAARG